jgi:tetratricopeptide (TPR) repeat protein
MKEKIINILFIVVIIIAAETTFLAFKPSGKDTGGMDIQKKLAEEYMNQGLYEKAVDSYEKYISLPWLGPEKKSNISYMIGNIYMDNLSDYNNALASFVRAKVYYPSNSGISGINKKIVMCLENLGKSVDAEREMSRITSLTGQGKEEFSKSEEDSVIVAKIGDRNITMGEFNREIERFPAPKEAFKEKKKKLEFLGQYIAGELLYDSAKRRGFDNDKEVIEAFNLAKKQMMINKLVEDEVDSKLEKPSEGDLKLYYEANKDKYMEEKKDEAGKITKIQREFEQVKDRVNFDYISMKRQEKIGSLLDNLKKTKDVFIYDDQFKEE